MNIEQIKKALALLRKKEWEACDYASNANEAADILEQVLKQPEPEPVAWWPIINGVRHRPVDSKFIADELKKDGVVLDPLYESPPKREPLTDEQVREIAKQYALGLAFPYDSQTTPEMFARAIERAHGIGEKK